MCFASVLLQFCTPLMAYMQLLEWLSLMKEVVMCNKNLMLESLLKVNSFASKTGIFARRARVDQAPGLY